MTWGELRAHCEQVLAEAARERPARLVLDWFDDVYGGASRRADEAVPKANLLSVEVQLRELADGRPLAYVTGVAHFYGYELEVGPGALIPRPETEELVRWILETHALRPALTFVDVCCGSGCIAVALALRRLTWRGIAVDVSPHALAYARRNVAKHDLHGNLDVQQVDVLRDWSLLDEGYDIIVSNPPYIPASDWHRVAEEVAAHEPRLALLVDGDTPLAFYERIADKAATALVDGGWLYFECNDRYAREVAQLLQARGWGSVEVFIDMQGKQRHVRGQRGDRASIQRP